MIQKNIDSGGSYDGKRNLWSIQFSGISGDCFDFHSWPIGHLGIVGNVLALVLKNGRKIGMYLKENKSVSINQLLQGLETIKNGRESQLNKESYLSYNYGYVAGEISGIKKAITLLSRCNLVEGD